MKRIQPNLIVILGPTATGKTALASNLSSLINGEIISADSRQVYRRLTIGTGKDYNDYIVDGIAIPCHLLDLMDPGSHYNVFQYQHDFHKAFAEIHERGKMPVLCGGSGMYIQAVIQGYRLIQVPVNQPLRDELETKPLEELIQRLKRLKKIHATTDIDNSQRAIRAIEIELYHQEHSELKENFPEIHPLLTGIKFERDILRQRITERLKQRLEHGMIEEVQELMDSGLTPNELIYYGLEYKFITQYIRGEMDYRAMFTLLNTAIHQFAKRQMTWFRRMEDQGMAIQWIDGTLPMIEKLQRIMELFNSRNFSAN